LTWATHEINEEVSLLQQMSPDSFAVFDYALDLLSARTEDLPIETWAVVISAATPAELLSVGYTAWVTYDIFQPAFEAWGKASESGNLDVAPKAIYNIAHMLQYEGRSGEAETMYERAIHSGDQAIAAIALTDVGYMRFKEGRINEAKQIYERVLEDVENRWAIGLTHLRLGVLSEMQNGLSEARDWYDLVLKSGFYELVPQAGIGLAHVELKEGRALSARYHYQKAVNSGHPMYAPTAALELSKLLIRFDQIEDACNMLYIALEIWNDDISPLAAHLLGQLLEDSGQIDGARTAYDAAVKSGHVEAAPAAALLLGRILEGEGEFDSALNLYREASECSVEEVAAEATANVERLIGQVISRFES
jgi:tetratricopeptide (TPR) repeat protein